MLKVAAGALEDDLGIVSDGDGLVGRRDFTDNVDPGRREAGFGEDAGQDLQVVRADLYNCAEFLIEESCDWICS